MKRIFIPLFFTAFLGLLSGCTKSGNVVYEDEIASKVYFVQAVTNPLQTVSAESLDESGAVTFCIYNAGNNSGNITVGVVADQDALDIYNVENGTSYRLLPEKYWSLEKDSFVMDTSENYQAYMRLTVDFEAVRADALDVAGYLLPLSIEAPSLKDVNYDYMTLFIRLSL